MPISASTKTTLKHYMPGCGDVWGVNGGTEIIPQSITGASIANGTITSSQLATSLSQTVVINLTAANIISMFTTPIVLVAAQGAGKVIMAGELCFNFTAATQFTGGGTVTIGYTGGNAVYNTISTGTITSASPSITMRVPIDVVAAANTALSITNASGVFAAGSGSAVITLSYKVV